MKNTLISGLLFLGGVYISLGAKKNRGIVLMLVLLIVVAVSVLLSLNMTMETFDSQYSQFYLLTPNSYNRGQVSPLVPNANLTGWWIDEQSQSAGLSNQIFEQMQFAAIEVGKTLPVGQSVTLTVNSASGDSRGSKLIITRVSNTQVRFRYNNVDSPLFDSTYIDPANQAGCNYKDPNKCIFKGYNISGEVCDSGNGFAYGRGALASFDENTTKGWLRTLYDRNGGGPGQIKEADVVREYINRCQNTPEGGFTKGVLTDAELQTPYSSIPANLNPVGFSAPPTQTQNVVKKVPGLLYVNDECAIFGGIYVGNIPADAIFILSNGMKIYLLE